MPYFKAPDNTLHFLSGEDIDRGFAALLPMGCIEMTDDEFDAIRDHGNNAVPQSVTRRQALLALLAAGKLDEVELIVQSSPRAVQIAWESAGTFERNNPLIGSLGSQAGFSDEDIDNLFEQAAKL